MVPGGAVRKDTEAQNTLLLHSRPTETGMSALQHHTLHARIRDTSSCFSTPQHTTLHAQYVASAQHS
jgi:hypothetical protein